MSSVKIIKLLLLATCLVMYLNVPGCHSQLTFSPNWGKRAILQQPTAQLFGSDSTNSAPQSSSTQSCNPKISMDSMLIIYRLIQNEANKMIECNSQQK